MPIFSFVEYTLMALFRKPGTWRQICKQKSSTFYTSNDACLKRDDKKKLLRPINKNISLKIAFAK